MGHSLNTDIALSRDRMRAVGLRNANGRTTASYSTGYLNNLSRVSRANHQNNPPQHSRLTNTRSDTTPYGPNLPIRPTVSSQRSAGSQSTSSIRMNQTEMLSFTDGACLGAVGGYDPSSNRRDAISDLNGLPRSKSVNHGIDQFPRNEATCSSSNSIPLPARTRCNNKREADTEPGQSYKKKAGDSTQAFGEGIYENVQYRTEACQTQQVVPEQSGSENKVSEVNRGVENCKSCFMLSMVALTISLGCAAMYSLLSCNETGCQE